MKASSRNYKRKSKYHITMSRMIGDEIITTTHSSFSDIEKTLGVNRGTINKSYRKGKLSIDFPYLSLCVKKQETKKISHPEITQIKLKPLNKNRFYHLYNINTKEYLHLKLKEIRKQFIYIDPLALSKIITLSSTIGLYYILNKTFIITDSVFNTDELKEIVEHYIIPNYEKCSINITNKVTGCNIVFSDAKQFIEYANAYLGIYIKNSLHFKLNHHLMGPIWRVGDHVVVIDKKILKKHKEM